MGPPTMSLILPHLTFDLIGNGKITNPSRALNTPEKMYHFLSLLPFGNCQFFASAGDITVTVGVGARFRVNSSRAISSKN